MSEETPSSLVTINEVAKLHQDVSSLYLSPKYSDFSFLIDGEKIPAHKNIVGVRSEYFDQLIQDLTDIDANVIAINVTSSTTFKKLLKYIYTGSITLDISDTDLYLSVMSLAHQYGLEELAVPLTKKIEMSINIKNVYSILNMATFNNMDALQEVCLKLLEENTEELVLQTDYLKLSQASMTSLLERDTLSLPEPHILKMVLKWRETNKDIDDQVLACVRFSHLTYDEMIETVWPANILSCKKFVEYMSEILEKKPKSIEERKQVLTDVNFATVEYKCEDISGTSPANLLNGNRNSNLYVYCTTTDKNGITIKLGQPRFINYITFMTYSLDSRHYKYYIEVSVDQKNWKKIVDYTNYPCHGIQHLYFPLEFTRYIRVVGTFSSVDQWFHIVYMEAYYKTKNVPQTKEGIIIPTENVVHTDKSSLVIEGNNQNVVNGFTDYNSYTYHTIGSGSITVELAQPYRLSNLKLLLYTGDPRTYKYYIETSPNKIDWELAWDHRNETTTGYQNATFKERTVVFIRIIGTYDSADANFHTVALWTPAKA